MAVFSDNATIIIIAMGSAGFVATIYHVISTCFCNQQNNSAEQTQRRRNVFAAAQTPSTEATNSMSYLIPSPKFQRKKSDDVANGDGDGGACAVCLGDFEEGEELRTLPECMHCSNVLCIDMWLYSHSSCPICRAYPTPTVLRRLPELGLHEMNTYHSVEMMQIALVQNGLVQR